MNYEIKNLYKRFTLQEIINMDAFTRSEVTCKRMMVKFRNHFSKDKTEIRIRPTKSGTIYDADLTYIDSNNKKHKCYCEFKTREKLYNEVYIEPKNRDFALQAKEKGCNYIYINFYDDTKTGLRHMYCWSTDTIDFSNLKYEKKSIAKTEVQDSHMQYQKRYLLPLNDAIEHHIINITELWPECTTEEYLELWRENFFNKK